MQKKELSKKQILVISLISLIVLSLLIGTDLYLKAGRPSIPAPLSSEPTEIINETMPDYSYAKINSSLDLVKEESYEPGPAELNLAYFYPEGADESNVINSYAGQLYKELSTLEAKYLASFYDLSDASPLDMAARLNKPAAAVTGRFNPNDPSQSPYDPASWTIDNFKNVNILFYDGDGNRINGYSAVQEIMSMASVYSYYHGMYDAESMKQYALSLFDNFRQSSTRIGDVYYCSGCLNKTIEEEALEAIEQENAQQLMEEEIAAGVITDKDSNISDDNSDPSDSFVSVQTQHSFVSNKKPTAEYAELPAEITQAPLEEESINNVYIPGEIYVQSTVGNQDTHIAPSSDMYEESNKVSTESFISDERSDRFKNGGIPSGIETMPQTESSADTVDISSSAQGSNDASNTQNPQQSNESVSILPDSISIQGGQSTEAPLPSEQANTIPAPKPEATKPKCPGHIDIYVSIRMKGMDDKKSIFKADQIGNDESNFNDNWHGWTDDKIAQAKLLNSYNWIDKYGLTLSAISGGESLTEEEIKSYMDKLSPDISADRRAVVEFALNSVGKVPYYWGGKPYCDGYDGNNFSTITLPDYRGRVLKGLDCSGWINWVYWSALSEPLKGESTGTLIGLGKRIKRGDLKPGDIIVRTGQDAHVVMFLEWTGDGKMLAVHETGGVINNVIVSEMTANWPYYRSLLD